MFCISRISDGPERGQLPQLSLLLVESLQAEQLKPGGEQRARQILDWMMSTLQ